MEVGNFVVQLAVYSMTFSFVTHTRSIAMELRWILHLQVIWEGIMTELVCGMQVIVDKDTDRIVGMHYLGPNAGEVILL